MKTTNHEYSIDPSSNVIATDKKNGGHIKTQSVEALLLLEILILLKEMSLAECMR